MRHSFLEALPLLPRHRAQRARTRTLSLDDVLDDARSSRELSAGVLDLVFMAYRYQALFDEAWKKFSGGKTPRPVELSDLLQLLYGALLSRDRTPGPVLVHEAVDAAKQAFGAQVAGVVNAFGRRTLEAKEQTLTDLARQPERALPARLRERWVAHPELLARASRQLLERPESGIWSFDAQGSFERRGIEAFLGNAKLQALDPGSWDFIAWMGEQKFARPRRFLDACAAPGGKLLAYLARTDRPPEEIVATEAKFKRLERLRENLARWGHADSVRSELHAWGEDKADADSAARGNFDVILADLPCSGSGTLHSRPDLVDLKWIDQLEATRALQRRILEVLRQRVAPGGCLVVSLCSVDPEEVAGITRMLKQEPVYRSWDRVDSTCEGLTAWRIDFRAAP